MTNRAAFVLEEFRLTEAKNTATQATYGSKARTVTVYTQLDEGNAQLLAQKILDENEEPVTFEQEVEGIVLPDAFIDGIPTYIPDYPKLRTDGRTMKMVAFSCDLETGISNIRIRG